MAPDHAYRYITSVGTQRIHISLYITVITIDAIVVFGANRMRNIMLSVIRLLQNCQQVCKTGEPLAAEACLFRE